MFFEYQGFGIFPCHCAGGEYHQDGSAAFCHAFCAFPPGLCGRRRSCVPGCSGAGPSQPFCPLLQGRRALLGQAALEAGRTPSEKQNKTPARVLFQGAPRVFYAECSLSVPGALHIQQAAQVVYHWRAGGRPAFRAAGGRPKTSTQRMPSAFATSRSWSVSPTITAFSFSRPLAASQARPRCTLLRP